MSLGVGTDRNISNGYGQNETRIRSLKVGALMGKGYEFVGDADADRINGEIRDWSNPKDLKKAIQERFPKWKDDKNQGKKRYKAFTKAIIDRTDFWGTTRGLKYAAVETRTGTAGVGKGRFEIITDAKGRYLGKDENVKTYMRHGNVYGHNIRTGRRAKIA